MFIIIFIKTIDAWVDSEISVVKAIYFYLFIYLKAIYFLFTYLPESHLFCMLLLS